MSFCTPLTLNFEAWGSVLRFGFIAIFLFVSLFFIIAKWYSRESWKGDRHILVICGLFLVGAVLWDHVAAVFTLIPPAFWVGVVTAALLLKVEELIRAGRFWTALKQLPATCWEQMSYPLIGLVFAVVPGLILHFVVCR